MNEQMGPVGKIIFGLIFTVVGGVVAFGFGKPILDKARASKSWPTTTGIVEESKVREHEDREDDSVTYSSYVRYKYNVDSRQHTSDTVWFGSYQSGSRSEHEEVVDHYPKNAEVKVYYNPNDSNISVLEPGATWSSYLVFGAGLLFLAVGLLAFVGPFVAIVFAMVIGDGGRSRRTGDDFSQPWSDNNTYDTGTTPRKPPSSQPLSEPTTMDDDGFDVG